MVSFLVAALDDGVADEEEAELQEAVKRQEVVHVGHGVQQLAGAQRSLTPIAALVERFAFD